MPLAPRAWGRPALSLARTEQRRTQTPSVKCPLFFFFFRRLGEKQLCVALLISSPLTVCSQCSVALFRRFVKGTLCRGEEATSSKQLLNWGKRLLGHLYLARSQRRPFNLHSPFCSF